MDYNAVITHFAYVLLGSAFVGLLVFRLAVWIIKRAGDD